MQAESGYRALGPLPAPRFTPAARGTALPTASRIRQLVDASGALVFRHRTALARLRDHSLLRRPSGRRKHRRAAFERLFTALRGRWHRPRRAAERQWQFHTASGDRDPRRPDGDARTTLARLAGPDRPRLHHHRHSGANRGVADLALRRGHLHGPALHDGQNPPALLVRDADGKPVPADVRVPFVADIPRRSPEAPGGATGAARDLRLRSAAPTRRYIDSPVSGTSRTTLRRGGGGHRLGGDEHVRPRHPRTS